MRSLVAVSGVVCAVFGVLGCSGANEPVMPGPEGDEPVTTGELAAPTKEQGLQFTMQRQIAPGIEAHFCKEFVVPEEGLDTDKLEHTASEGTHHVLVYHTPLTAKDVTGETFDCGAIPGPVVYSSQKLAESNAFPEGVGARFAGGSVVRVESHYLNTESVPRDAEVRFNLWRAAAPLKQEAGGFFFYDRDIGIPAHGAFTARMHCEISTDIEIAFLLPHTHVIGTAQRIMISGPDLVAPTLIVTSKGYGDLETRAFSTPIKVKAGQSLDFECDYQNPSDRGVVEGPSKTENEMCMILGGYFPRMDAAAEWCTGPGSGPLHAGNKTCAEALACAQASPEGAAPLEGEQCFLDVCEGSSRAINDLTNCGFNKCALECPGPECGACSARECGAEFAACQAATCD